VFLHGLVLLDCLANVVEGGRAVTPAVLGQKRQIHRVVTGPSAHGTASVSWRFGERFPADVALQPTHLHVR
jgi:hypothetical protein